MALDQRRHAGRGGTEQLLVAEHQQVLEVAAAAGDDDDVDFGIGVQLGDRTRNVAGRAVALHLRVAYPELHGRPAELGVAQHILLGVRVLAA